LTPTPVLLVLIDLVDLVGELVGDLVVVPGSARVGPHRSA